jgi:hypothetical protein
LIKKRCGIAEAVTVYDADIQMYIDDCKEDLKASGVPEDIIDEETAGVITAVTMYVKANMGNDRSDTNRYMDLYRKKVFRLSMEGDEDVES